MERPRGEVFALRGTIRDGREESANDAREDRVGATADSRNRLGKNEKNGTAEAITEDVRSWLNKWRIGGLTSGEERAVRFARVAN